VPTARANGVSLHYVEAGSGPQTIVFAHGLCMDSESFRDQLRTLSDRYRVIAYDSRGHGRSEVPAGTYDMDTLTADAAAFIEAVRAAPCHFAGLSMGGMVAMRLALRRPELLQSLVLIATSADAATKRQRMLTPIGSRIIEYFGFRPLLSEFVPSMYGRTWLGSSAHREWATRYVLQLPRNLRYPLTVVAARKSIAAEIHTIKIPTLVMVGSEDILLPPSHAKRIAAAIEGARLVIVPDTGHLISDENPQAVDVAVERFVASLTPQGAPA